MILQQAELLALKPFIAMAEHTPVTVTLTVSHVQGRTVSVEISAAGIIVKGFYPDSIPAVEFYRYPVGLAQAYGIPLLRVTNIRED